MIEQDYNTQRQKMKLPEYGRNIHKMVQHIMTIEDRQERMAAVKAIIDVMGTMYPYLRDINEFKHKLWDHIAIISDFKLDIDYPYDPPKPETFTEKPKLIPYQQSDIDYRHYGKIVQHFIAATTSMEDENPAKNTNIELIANQMKKSYLLWNKDAVEDAKILKDLNELSKGRLQPRPDLRLQESIEIFKPQGKKGKISYTSSSNRKKEK